jgi:hypothetical protein
MYGKVENPVPVQDLEQPVGIERVMRLNGKGAGERQLLIMLRVQTPSDAILFIASDPIQLYPPEGPLQQLAVGRLQLEQPSTERLEFHAGARERLRLAVSLPEELARPGQKFRIRLFWMERSAQAGSAETSVSRLYRVRLLRVNYAVVGGLATVLAWSFAAVVGAD